MKSAKFSTIVSVQLAFWALFGSVSFVVAFLRARGLAPSTIGVILAINTALFITVQPLWGLLADRLGSVRGVFVFCLLGSALPFALFPFLQSSTAIVVLVAISVVLRAPLISLLDTWVIEEVRNQPHLDYGRIRAWGAISYSPVVLLYGWMADKIGIESVFPGYLLFAVLTAVLFLKMTKHDHLAAPTARLRAGRLLRRPRFLAFVIFAATVQIPVSAVFNFLPMVVSSVGGSTVHLGLLYFVRGLSEIPAFLATKKAARSHRYLLLMVAGAALYLIQLFLYTMIQNLLGLVFIQLVRGPAFALFLTGAVHYVRSIAPAELKATAQATARSLYQGVGGVLGNLGGGLIIEQSGLPALFRTGLALSSVGLAAFLAYTGGRRYRAVSRRRKATQRRVSGNV